MRWTIKECSFVERFDEPERDSVLGFVCQLYIDPVLIFNDCWSNTHFDGATGKAIGSLNWLMGELSFHVRQILSFWVSTRQRQNDMNGARVTSSLQNSTLAEHDICSAVRTFLPGLYTIKFTVNS